MPEPAPLPAAWSRPASLDAVLAYAWDAAVFTATEAMRATGMTRSTVIEAMDALAGLGILSELPNAREAGTYLKGRPARRFSLRADAAVLIGVDAGHGHLKVRVTDLACGLLDSRGRRLDPLDDDPAVRSGLVQAIVDEALEATARTRADVLAICAGVPAPVDAAGRSPRHPTGFWDRMNPGLIDALSWAPIVRVDNDASLAAVAEGAVGSAIGRRDYVALLAGDRLGAGVVVDGNLLRGSHGGVGEMVAFDHVEGVGSADGLGTRLARWAAEAVARGEVASDGSLAAVPPGALDGRAVLALASRGDPDAKAVADRVGDVLGRIVSVLGSMFDPELVVLSGAVAAAGADLAEAARRALPTGLDLPAPEIAVSRLGADVVVIGAVAAAAAAARAGVLDVWPARPATSL